jgi:hypothetical protein
MNYGAKDWNFRAFDNVRGVQEIYFVATYYNGAETFEGIPTRENTLLLLRHKNYPVNQDSALLRQHGQPFLSVAKFHCCLLLLLL